MKKSQVDKKNYKQSCCANEEKQQERETLRKTHAPLQSEKTTARVPCSRLLGFILAAFH
jgi:hypothetical protein